MPGGAPGTRNDPSWHPAVIHTCQLPNCAHTNTPVIHVVLAPRQIGETPLTDIQDAGYDLLAASLFLGELEACDAVNQYSHCQHCLLRALE